MYVLSKRKWWMEIGWLVVWCVGFYLMNPTSESIWAGFLTYNALWYMVWRAGEHYSQQLDFKITAIVKHLDVKDEKAIWE